MQTLQWFPFSASSVNSAGAVIAPADVLRFKYVDDVIAFEQAESLVQLQSAEKERLAVSN